MKLCTACDQILPLGDFYTNGKTPKGHQKYKPTCKGCELKAAKDQYYALILEEFGAWKCQECPFEGHPKQFDCHHRDEAEKDFSISQRFQMARNSPDRFRAELRKCSLLCACCHRLKH